MKPNTIPIIIGFLTILIHAFLILSVLWLTVFFIVILSVTTSSLSFIFCTVSYVSISFTTTSLGCALNVSTTTANILNSGTAATIISGAIPVSEYIFCTNAIPRIAALLLQLPCINAPFCVSSFISNSVNIQTSENISIVTILQYRTNFGSNWLLKSDFERSLNKSTGSATLKTYLLATLAKCSSIMPIFLITPPSTITRNTGTVALILYIKLSTIISIPPQYMLILQLF